MQESSQNSSLLLHIICWKWEHPFTHFLLIIQNIMKRKYKNYLCNYSIKLGLSFMFNNKGIQIDRMWNIQKFNQPIYS